jgi:hypothetical protein
MIHIINAMLHNYKLNNRFKALRELMIAEDSNPNVQEEFSIF